MPDAAGGESVVRCVGLSKVFRDFWMRDRVRAVDAVDLEVRRGEVLGLLGPNGSGKSTTIKMILGVLYPTAGRVTVFDKPPEDVATKKRIGFLPEESNLYPFLNARETLDYYGRLFAQPRRQRKKRIDMLLEMVGLEAVQTRPVGRYSKGMQRRIGLAQALINDPQLLILDEPTSGMDPIGTRQIKDLILELARRRKTVLLCSHLLADVEDVCDRVSIMFGGRVRATGSVGELLTRQDATTISSSALSDEVIQKVGAVLRAYGKRVEKVEKPRQKLESLFLEIVRRAQKEGLSTSGAGSGGKIADFLLEGQPRRDDSRGENNARGIEQTAEVIGGLIKKSPIKTQDTASSPHERSNIESRLVVEAKPVVDLRPISEPESVDSTLRVADSDQPGVDEVGDLSVIESLMSPSSPAASQQEPVQEKEPTPIEPLPIEPTAIDPTPIEEPPPSFVSPSVPPLGNPPQASDENAMLKEMMAQQYELDIQNSQAESQPTGSDSQADASALTSNGDVGSSLETVSTPSIDNAHKNLSEDRSRSSGQTVDDASVPEEDDEEPDSSFLEAMDDVPPFVPEKKDTD